MPTRPDIGWSDLGTARVGLWGIGAEAEASVRRLRQLGVKPVLVDDDPAAAHPLGPVLATDGPGAAALAGCDVVVKAPGIPPHHPVIGRLLEADVALTGGLALWLHDAPADRVVAVTGTKGKSTTVSLLGHLLRGLGHDVFVGGNLGQPPFDPDTPDDVDAWIVEVSSYQAADVARSPRVVAVTSLSPDHLQWHGSVDQYYRDKLSLTSQPGVEVTVASGADATLREHAALLGGEVEWISPDGDDGWTHALPLQGRHNRVDARIAAACARHLVTDGADDPARLAAAVAGFEGLPSRLQTVLSHDGVTVVDDSLSTNVLSCVAALEVFADRPVALLVGGQDRGIEYDGLGEAIAARTAPTLLVGLATNGPRVLAEATASIEEHGGGGEVTTTTVDHTTDDPAGLRKATSAAIGWARTRAGVVLLSPAAPSFDHFRDYRERSAVFRSAAHAELGPA